MASLGHCPLDVSSAAIADIGSRQWCPRLAATSGHWPRHRPGPLGRRAGAISRTMDQMFVSGGYISRTSLLDLQVDTQTIIDLLAARSSRVSMLSRWSMSPSRTLVSHDPHTPS